MEPVVYATNLFWNDTWTTILFFFSTFFFHFLRNILLVFFFWVKPLQSEDIKSWVCGEFQFNCPIIYGYLLFGFNCLCLHKNQLKDKINYLCFGDLEVSFVVLILALVGSTSFHYGPQFYCILLFITTPSLSAPLVLWEYVCLKVTGVLFSIIIFRFGYNK